VNGSGRFETIFPRSAEPKIQTSLKVFGIGLSKTGTTSLYAALHVLGYRSGTFGHLRALGLEKWFNGDFSHDYLKDFDAVTDLPIGLFYKQLDLRYPGSKFILTIRDLEPWLASCERQFSKRPNPPEGFHRRVRTAAYGATEFDRDRFIERRDAHHAGIRAYFAQRPEDLLELDICGGEGWDALCPFLGRELPETPFPNEKPGYRIESEVRDDD